MLKILYVLVIVFCIIGCDTNYQEKQRQENIKKIENMDNHLKEQSKNIDEFNKKNRQDDGLLDKNFNRNLEEYERNKENTKKKYAGEETAKTAAQPGGLSIPQMVISLVIWGAVLYFFLIKPQKKRTQQFKDMMSSVKVGDEIITKGGIKGEIVSQTEEFYEVRIDKGVKLTLKKDAIASIYKSN